MVCLAAEGVAKTHTYGSLRSRVESIGEALRQGGLGPGDRLLVPSMASADVPATYLACSALGAAYVPVSLTWPAARLERIVADSGARLAADFGEPLPAIIRRDLEVLDVRTEVDAEELPMPAPDIEAPAYIMYTSGSTGTPKGAVVPNRAILRLVVDTDFMQFDANTRFAQLAAQTFDAATLEIWGPLLNGGCCVMVPQREIPDLDLVRKAIDGHGVNAMWLTASLFNFIIDESAEMLRPLSVLLSGGEALSVPHVVKANRLLPNTQLINGYGPTENTTFTCCYRIPKEFPADASSVPIGTPIRGTSVRVEPVEGEAHADATGELIAGGKGLALGYLRRPEETAARFVSDPEEPSRLVAYRTGDLVRRREDGLLEFLGRLDQQVKINGHRIEPGEIDAVALGIDGVRQMRTVLRVADGQKRLVGYYVGSCSELELRTGLRVSLPDFMLPARLVSVPELPFNANHKLDLDRLPNPFEAKPALRPATSLSLTDEVAAIWRRAVVGIAEFGHDDNFFDVGGSSLDALEVVKECERLVGREISAVKAFEFPTVRALAKFLEQSAESPEVAARSRAQKRRASMAKRRTSR